MGIEMDRYSAAFCFQRFALCSLCDLKRWRLGMWLSVFMCERLCVCMHLLHVWRMIV